jgi:signal transduction histidine kinase
VLTAERRPTPWVAAATTLLLWLASVVAVVMVDRRLSQLGRHDLSQLTGAGVVFLFAEASACLVGAALVVRKPENAVGWCMAALGCAVALAGACQSYGLLGLVADPRGHHPGAGTAAALASSLFVLWLIAVALVFYLTPTGHALSVRWSRCAGVMTLCGLAWFVTVLLDPGELESPFGGIENPLGIDSLRSVLGPARVLTGSINNVLVLVSFAALLVRFRRSAGEERRQLLWLGMLAVPVPFLVLATYVAAMTDNEVLLNLTAGLFVAVLPVAVGLAVAKTRLYDVDRLLSRAVSYALLSAVLAGTYAGVVLLVGQRLGGSDVTVALATLAAAVLARPAHRTLQAAVDRRFSRRRYDALQVVRAHVSSPDPATDIEQVLRQALREPSLAVQYWVQEREEWVTGDGRQATAPAYAMTVHRGGRKVARVSADGVEPELARAVLREAEPELDNAGLRAAIAVQLEDVRASRQRLATAQLDERRRVERDLHDGAQQRLLALGAQLQAALLNGDPARMREALGIGVEQSQIAVRELRQLANGLHPSVLVDSGLAAALDDLANRHGVEVQMAEPSRRYPPRIEATAWFIACEAVANAVKHAQAGRIRVVVGSSGEGLSMCVEDDGRGGADAAGSGLRGLADRAEAVGGHLDVLPRRPSGTTIRAVLPCAS